MIESTLKGRAVSTASQVSIRREGPVDVRIALVQTPAWGPLPPLGIATLKSFLTKHGVEARCFDLNIDFHNDFRTDVEWADGRDSYGGADPWGADAYGQWSLDFDSFNTEIRFNEGSIFNDQPPPFARWASEIVDYRPQIVGLSTQLTSLAASLLLAHQIKELDPSILIVFGGPDSAQDQHGDYVLRSGLADLVVSGEGEEALLRIARAVDNGDEPSNVAGGRQHHLG